LKEEERRERNERKERKKGEIRREREIQFMLTRVPTTSNTIIFFTHPPVLC
jgi:hypothetical protein